MGLVYFLIEIFLDTMGQVIFSFYSFNQFLFTWLKYYFIFLITMSLYQIG